MTNSKGETSGKAIGFTNTDGAVWNLYLALWVDDVFQEERHATVEDIAAALLANPEARMAVLDHFWSPEECVAVEKRAAELWQAIGEPELRRKLAEAESRLPHLEEAAELLRSMLDDSINGRGLWPETWVNWYDRDQALSAPTAESGKDHHIDRRCCGSDNCRPSTCLCHPCPSCGALGGKPCFDAE